LRDCGAEAESLKIVVGSEKSKMASQTKPSGGKELKKINVQRNPDAEKTGMKSYASLLKKCEPYLHSYYISRPHTILSLTLRR